MSSRSFSVTLIQRWLTRRQRLHVHFTPTSSSWLNLVESFFPIVDSRVTRRGVHRSTHALEQDVRKFLVAHNSDPKPFVWTKTADQILDSLKRYCTKVNAVRTERLFQSADRTEPTSRANHFTAH
jgi:hypothetical protein